MSPKEAGLLPHNLTANLKKLVGNNPADETEFNSAMSVSCLLLFCKAF
jgi:hypothetical protein